MSDEEDKWPLPGYNPGPAKHLHALGVIALTFANLQAAMDALYVERASIEKLPHEIMGIYYFGMNEDKRIIALNALFNRYEKDKHIRILVVNLIKYFGWCRHCRNTLLHSEQYPASLGALNDVLYLTKRQSKTSQDSIYMRLTLDQLRSVADSIRAGVVQSAELRIHVRYRGIPAKEIHPSLRVYINRLPDVLAIPPELDLHGKANDLYHATKQ